MGEKDSRNGGRVSQSFLWGLANSENIGFYQELESRGKKTPLSDRPILDLTGNYYFSIILKLRKMSAPITLMDLSAYCSMFKVVDKERLLEIVLKVNQDEKANV